MGPLGSGKAPCSLLRLCRALSGATPTSLFLLCLVLCSCIRFLSLECGTPTPKGTSDRGSLPEDGCTGCDPFSRTVTPPSVSTSPGTVRQERWAMPPLASETSSALETRTTRPVSTLRHYLSVGHSAYQACTPRYVV